MSLTQKFKSGTAKTPRKKEVKYVISDMDNTFTDTIKAWTHATDRALNRFAASRGLSTDDIDKAIRKMPDEFRFGDITQMLGALSDEFNGKSPAEKARLAKIDHDIRKEWYESQAKNTHFYAGVVETLRELKRDTRAKFIIYTDSREHTCLRRLYNLTRNHAKLDPTFNAQELYDLVDGIYVQPGKGVPGPKPQTQEEADFWALFKQKQVALPHRSSKPNPANMKRILREIGARKDEAIMLGDTALDGGSARPAGVDFVWVPYGTQVSEKSLRLFDRIGPKHWYIGYDYVKGSFDDTSKPHYKFHKGLHELFEQFTFPGKDAANDNKAKPRPKKTRKPAP